jgi:hypothetical protein
VHRAGLDAGGAGVPGEEVLDLPLLERPLAAGEEVGSCLLADPEKRAEQLGGMAPEWLVAAKAVLQAPN